jgi:hypothetical protein
MFIGDQRGRCSLMASAPLRTFFSLPFSCSTAFLLGRELCGKPVQIITNYLPLANYLIDQEHDSVCSAIAVNISVLYNPSAVNPLPLVNIQWPAYRLFSLPCGLRVMKWLWLYCPPIMSVSAPGCYSARPAKSTWSLPVNRPMKRSSSSLRIGDTFRLQQALTQSGLATNLTCHWQKGVRHRITPEALHATTAFFLRHL